MSVLPPFLKELGVLGAGGQKRVLLVEDLRGGETLAAAEVPGKGEASRARVHEVARVLQAGRAACIAPIREVIEADGRCWLLAEHFPGGDLARYLARRGDAPLPARDALEIASRVARALAHAHAQGVVHGDVKPSNVLIDGRGDTYLADFSLLSLGERGPGRPASTLAYMAPELFEDAPATAACDLYALGCLLFELLTGVTPFHAEDADETLRRHQLDEPPRVSPRVPDAPRLLDALLLKLLAKRPDRRPASAADVAHTLQGLRDELTLRRGATQGIVARRAAHERVGRILADVAGGAGESLRVEGSAGIGKSLLLEQLVELAEARGFRVIRACGDEGHERPHGCVADLVRPLATWLDEVEADEAATLRRLLAPVGGDASHDLVDPSPRGAVTRALAAALRRWATSGPLAVLVDDVQWVDGDSRDALDAIDDSLACGVARMPGLLLVRAERTHSGGAAPDKARHGNRIALRPLDESEVFELLLARGLARPTDHLVRHVMRASDGIPLLAGLLLDRLQRSGHLAQRDGQTVLAGAPEAGEPSAMLAGTVRSAIVALDSDARHHLEWAACFGPSFTDRQLRDASGKTAGSDELSSALRHAGLVERSGSGHRFRHPLIWREVLHSIDPVRREELHRRIADWAIGSAAAQSDEQPGQVVHHLLRAGALATEEELATWVRAAGDVAYRRFAWRGAADLFEDAISRCETRADVSPELLAELHRRAGLSHYFCFEPTLGVHHLERAVELFEGARDALGHTRALHDLVRAVAQSGGVAYGTMGRRVAELREALHRLGARSPELRARILASLAEASWTAQRSAEADGFARQALELASRIGDQRLCGEAHIQIAISAVQRLDLSLALSHLRQAEAHGGRAGDAFVSRLALGRLPIVLFTLGRIDEAGESLRSAIAAREVVENPGDAALERSLATLLAAAAGDADGAEREAAETLQMVRRIGFPWPRLLLHPALAYARVLRRDFVGAVAAVRELVEPGVVFDDPSSLRDANRRWVALIHWYAGDPLALRVDDLGEDCLPDPDAPLDLPHLVSLGLYVELCDAACVAAHPRAEAALARAQAHGAVLSVSWPFLLPRSRGLAALGRGRVEEAAELLRQALGFAQKLGSPLELARTRYELARALSLTGTRLADLEAERELRLAVPVLARVGPIVHGERAGRLETFLNDRIG